MPAASEKAATEAVTESVHDHIARIYYALDLLNAKLDGLVKASNERFMDLNRILISQSTFSTILSHNVQQMQCAANAAAAMARMASMSTSEQPRQAACSCFKDSRAAPGCSFCETASNENK